MDNDCVDEVGFRGFGMYLRIFRCMWPHHRVVASIRDSSSNGTGGVLGPMRVDHLRAAAHSQVSDAPALLSRFLGMAFLSALSLNTHSVLGDSSGAWLFATIGWRTLLRFRPCFRLSDSFSDVQPSKPR